MLNGNDLGTEIYNAVSAYNNEHIEPENLEVQRLAYWKVIGNAIVDHFKANGVVIVLGTGLTAGTTPVTGNANGTIE